MFDTLLKGMSITFTLNNVLWIMVGVLLGMTAGVLPGITGGTMMALLMPIMYKMPVSTMTMTIVGIYAASVYAGGITGTLYNIPGEPQGVPTTIEGYRLTLQGKSREALSIAASASLFGNSFGVVCMIVLIPLFLQIISFFGTAERGLFGLWAMVLISAGVLTREDPIKGILGMGIGLIMGTVGIQANTGGIRFSGSFPPLWDGFDTIWVVMGVYAIAQLMLMPRLQTSLDEMRNISRQAQTESPWQFYGLGIKQVKEHFGVMLKGSILGTGVGIIPGIGAMTAAWLAYATAQKTGKHPELVGKGSVEAIACIESANNSAVPGTLIPMFSLGIPGNTTAAIIMSMFIMAGLYPGPQMMQQNGDVVWSIIWGCFVTGVLFWFMAYPFRLATGYMLKLPVEWMIAVMGPMIMMGGFLAKNTFTGGNIALALTLLAVFCGWAGISTTGLLLGNILCRLIEVDIVRAYQLDGMVRFLKPSALIMIVLILATIGLGIYQNNFSKKRKENSASALKMVGQGDDEDYLTDQEDNVIELDEEQKKLSKEEKKELSANKDAFTRLISGLIAIALAIAVIVISAKFNRLAMIWPRVIAVCFISFPGIILLIQAFLVRHKIFRFLKARPPVSKRGKRQILNGWVIYALMILCFNLSSLIGFIEGCALFSFIIILYLKPKKYSHAILALLVTVAFVAGMKYGFRLLLPRGPLGI